MRLTLLLLISIGIAAAAPVEDGDEKVKKPVIIWSSIYLNRAREFFGKAATLGKQGKYGEVFDMFSSKREEFIPGLLKDEHIQKIRKQIVDEMENKTTGDFTAKDMGDLIDIAWQGVKYQIEKSTLLTEEANKFFWETPIFPPEISDLKKLVEISPNFIEYRKKFNALSTPAKDSLIKAYPAYGRLEEIQAYGEVFDSIIRNLKGLCTELPGFAECDKLMKAF